MPQGGWNIALAALILAVGAHGQPAPEAYAGSARCAQCHPQQAKRQASSAHAGALYRVDQHPLAAKFPAGRRLARKPAYRFDFDLAAPQFRIRIFDSADVMELPVEWGFGAGRQAVTFVTRADRDWYIEHYASYYPATGAYGPTPGQDALQPESLPRAAGLMYKTADTETGITGCFQCHSTGPVKVGPEGEMILGEQGVRCEACHGAGTAHAANPAANRMVDPRKFSAVRMNEFCGQCHRPAAGPGVQVDWNYAWNVRHAPIYLAQSRCFSRSKGQLSCVTCHDPHEPAGEKKLAEFNRNCAVCHSAAQRPPKPVCTARTPANCADCHMPLVSPQSPLRFTNHWIGVYREGAKLKADR